MSQFREWLSRTRGVLRRRALDERLREELAFHLDSLEEKYQKQGMSPSAARLAAKRELGGVLRTQEEFREQGGLPWLDSLRSDLLFAVRSFARTPGITLLIVLTLGLGIGANTAIFSFLSELLLRPLPYPEAGRLVAIGRQWPGQFGATTTEEFVLIRDHAKSFSAVGTSFLYHGKNLEAEGTQSQHVVGLQVSEGYFRALGVAPFLGRTFTREEDTVNGPKAVVLSYSVWQSLFQSDRNVLDRTIRVSGIPHTVVGVMPETFDDRERAKIWLPLQSDGRGNSNNYTMVARLKPGITVEQATAETDALFAELDRPVLAKVAPEKRSSRLPGVVVPLQNMRSGEFRQPLLLLYGGVCVVLFVACLNVANLLLARSAARAKEIAVRASLGAGQARIFRQLLTESALLAGLGCLAGLLIGSGFAWLLSRAAPYPALQGVTLDRTTLLVTLLISFAVGVTFGLVPAVYSLRVKLSDVLKEGSGRVSAGVSALRGRQALVITQVAFCTVLLAASGLLVRTFVNLRTVDMGFDPHNVLTSQMSLNADKLANKDALVAYYEQAIDRVRAIAGVEGVAVTTQLPVEGQFNLPFDLPDSGEPQRIRGIQFRAQTPGALGVLGMRIVRGRDFAATDRAGSPPVALVNEAFVRQYFPGQEVLGKRIGLTRFKVASTWTIAGVVGDVRETGLRSPAPPAAYMVIQQLPQAVIQIVHGFVPAKWIIRVRPGSGDVARQVKEAVGSFDAAQPFQAFQSMDSIVAETIQIERFLMLLLGAFSLLTLTMVASGLYGTLAYLVVQRRQEIGIRMALGAKGSDVVRMVLASGAFQVACGLVLGLAGCYWLSKLMTGFLFNVSALDPTSLLVSGGVLLAVSALSCLGPSLTAVRTDPLKTLRAQ